MNGFQVVWSTVGAVLTGLATAGLIVVGLYIYMAGRMHDE